MKEYNFSPENIDDINTQKSNFFAELTSDLSNLIDLGLYSYSTIDKVEKSFWKVFTANHLEIRSDERLVRHFILKKKEKMAKELKTGLFGSEIYTDLPDKSKNSFWKFIHTMFLLFETAHENKSQAIINTLTEELEKVLQAEEAQVVVASSGDLSNRDELTKKLHNKIGRQAKSRSHGANPLLNQANPSFDMSKLNSMMSSFGLDPSNPESLDPSKLMDVMGKLIGGANDPTQPNPLEQLGLGSDMKDLDVGNLINQLMPGMAEEKNENLMQTLMNDITSSMGNLESADQAIDTTKKLGQKYKELIESGQINPSEIIGSLMGLMTDKSFNEQLAKIDMSKIKPEEMVSKMISEVSPEMLSSLTGGAGVEGLDLGNIGSLVSSVAGLTSTTNSVAQPSSEQKELTPEQLKELEEYYSNIQVESQPELD